MLDNVTVTGKSKTQRLREGALSVNAIDVRSIVSSISSLSGLVDRTAGVKLREEGGVGSDFDLSINGMSGNSVRYFLDGVPLDTKGSGVTLTNLPTDMATEFGSYPQVWYYLNDNKNDSVLYTSAEQTIAVSESTKVCVYILDEDSDKVLKSKVVEAEYTILRSLGLRFYT